MGDRMLQPCITVGSNCAETWLCLHQLLFSFLTPCSSGKRVPQGSGFCFHRCTSSQGYTLPVWPEMNISHSLTHFTCSLTRYGCKRCTHTHTHTNKAHTSLISPHLPSGHRDLHRQLIFPAHISHQSDKKSDASSFSGHTHPPPSQRVSAARALFFEGIWSVARRSNRGLLDPDGRRLGRLGC